MDEFTGEIVEVFSHKTKSDETMCFLIVESNSEAIEIVVFPRLVKECKSILEKGKIIKAKGEFHTDEETDMKQLVADGINEIEL